MSSNPLAVNRHKSCTCIDAAPSPSSSMSVCIVSRKLLFSGALPLWQHPVSARWLNFRGNLVLYTHSRRPRIKMNSIQFGAFDLHCMTESKVEGSIPVMASLVFYGKTLLAIILRINCSLDGLPSHLNAVGVVSILKSVSFCTFFE